MRYSARFFSFLAGSCRTSRATSTGNTGPRSSGWGTASRRRAKVGAVELAMLKWNKERRYPFSGLFAAYSHANLVQNQLNSNGKLDLPLLIPVWISARRKKSRWGDEKDKVDLAAPMVANPQGRPTELLMYAMKVFGSTDLEEHQWKQCEDQLKVIISRSIIIILPIQVLAICLF